VCLIARRPGGVSLRKLAPTQAVLVNGRPVTGAGLSHGDRIALASVELVVHIQRASATETKGPPDAALPPSFETVRRRLQEQTQALREQVVSFEQERQQREAELL